MFTFRFVLIFLNAVRATRVSNILLHFVYNFIFQPEKIFTKNEKYDNMLQPYKLVIIISLFLLKDVCTLGALQDSVEVLVVHPCHHFSQDAPVPMLSTKTLQIIKHSIHCCDL